MKFKLIVTPDGLALHVDGAHEGRRHDQTIWRRSKLDEKLEQILIHEDVQYRIYGDNAYTRQQWIEISHTVLNLTGIQRNDNEDRSASRVTVHWFFKESKRYWPQCDFKRSLRVLEAPVGTLIKAAMLLTNMRNCFYPDQISQYFGVHPPTIENYTSNRHLGHP